jgi:multidrug efflux pump subunit AcrB
MRHVVDAPDLHLDIDRIKAAQFGLTQRDVANSISISLTSSGAVKPNFRLGPKMASLNLVAAQTPQYPRDRLFRLKQICEPAPSLVPL